MKTLLKFLAVVALFATMTACGGAETPTEPTDTTATTTEAPVADTAAAPAAADTVVADSAAKAH
jgi:hypothetical protein